MKSAPHGQSTSVAEVTNVSARVFWILLAEEKRFVPFADFPWFQEAPIRALTHLNGHHPITSSGRIKKLTWQSSLSVIQSCFLWYQEPTHNIPLEPTSLSSLRSSSAATELNVGIDYLMGSKNGIFDIFHRMGFHDQRRGLTPCAFAVSGKVTY
jgi:hypothetical protein